MIRFALCDDNPLQLDLTRDILAECLASRSEETAIFPFTDSRALLNDVRTNGSYDVYLLDMLMPDMNGMELATTLRLLKDDGEIVFLTSTLEYAVQSYDVHAFYYLLKPIDSMKFTRVIHDLLDKLNRSKPDLFEVKTPGGSVAIHTQSIVTVTAENRLPTFRLNDGRIVTGIMMRRKFREELSPLLSRSNFVECGVSRVLNLAYIDMMDSESILLNDGTVIYPPQSAVSEISRKWLEYKQKR